MPEMSDSMAKDNAREAGFEDSISALEEIVKQLETGDLPLERALELFERGVLLARRCQEQLTVVEQRVEILLRERGEVKAGPFEMPREAEKPEGEKSAAPSAIPAGVEPQVALDYDDDIPF